MNEHGVEEALEQYGPNSGASVWMTAATVTLYRVMSATNQVADGWSYWPKPCRAAKRLQKLIQRQQRVDRTRRDLPRFPDPGDDVTEAEVWAAFTPLKALRTRQIGKSDIWFTIEYGGE